MYEGRTDGLVIAKNMKNISRNKNMKPKNKEIRGRSSNNVTAEKMSTVFDL